MNTAIHIRFATPYINSLTRDDTYVHSLNPLDGAISYALFWRIANEHGFENFETEGRIVDSNLQSVVVDELRKIFVEHELGGAQILNNGRTEKIFLVSSGFPVVEGIIYVRVGARYEPLPSVLLMQPTGVSLQPRRVVQPLRKRVDPMRLLVSDIQPIQKSGKPMKKDIETNRSSLKSIDNRIITWEIFEYVWFTEIVSGAEPLLRSALDILKYQGMGKKRSAGFGRVAGYEIKTIQFPQITRRVFWKWGPSQSILIRPIPYSSTVGQPIVLTNQVLEFGGGTQPPYWSERETVIREGTIFDFQ